MCFSRQILTALYFFVLLVLLSLAAYCRFKLPLVPVIDRDFRGYLYPALKALEGGPFEHINGRASLYPRLVYVLLWPTRDFRAIMILQHIMSLATGLILLASWSAAYNSVTKPIISRRIYNALGLGVFATFAFAPQPVQFAFLIRPDVICPFFAALSYFSIIKFLLAWRIEKNGPKTYLFAGVAIFVSLALPLLKPSYWLSSVFTILPALAIFGDRTKQIFTRLGLVFLPLTIGYLLLFFPEERLASADSRSSTFLPESVFSIHGLIIREQIASDLKEASSDVPYDQEQLRSILNDLDSGIAAAHRNSPGHMSSLGYDADWLLYHDTFFSTLLQHHHGNQEAELAFCRYYYRRTWIHRPVAMLGKIFVQLGLFYNLNCPAYSDKHYQLQKNYVEANELLNDPNVARMFDPWPPAAFYSKQIAALKEQSAVIRIAPFLRTIIDDLKVLYLPILGAWFLSLSFLLRKAEFRLRLGLLATIVSVGFASNFGNNLGIAVLHTLQVNRYSYIQFATTLLSETLAAFYLLEFAIILARDRYGFAEYKPTPYA